MKKILLLTLVGVASLGFRPELLAAASSELAATAAEPAPAPPPSAGPKRSAAELEKLVEPIALHPDPLISIILPASAYPLEIVQAARFVKDTNNIPKVDDQDWDDNVKEVAKFPEVIAMMDKDLTWTTDLGQAFIDQGKEVMDAIQTLRAKAQKAGNLKTSEHQIVTVTNIVVQQTNITEVTQVTKEIVQVAPANPQVVYVPTYPPAVYYPPPAYAVAAPLISFGVGMAWGAVLANNCNWGGGSVDIDVNRNVNRNTDRNRSTDRSGNRSQSGNRASSTGARSGSQQWKPNQSRVQQSGSKASASTQNARGWGGSSGAKPSTGSASARPSTGAAGSGASARPSTSQSSSRGSSPSASSRSSSGGSAFSGGSGSSARSSSARGSSSRSSGGSRGGGGGGGGGRGGGGGGGRR